MSESNKATELLIGDASPLTALLAALCETYERVSLLAERQRTLITGDTPEELLNVLAERQKLLDRLNVLTQQLAPYRENWATVRQQLTADEGQHVDQLVGQMETLVGSILKSDERDTQLLAARRGSSAHAMAEAKSARQAKAAYHASTDLVPSQMEWADQ